MATHGIVQGTMFRSASGAVYDIKSSFLRDDAIECPGCGKDAPLRRVRETGTCPHCDAQL